MIHDLIEEQGSIGIVMEYMGGGTLLDRMNESDDGRLEVAAAGRGAAGDRVERVARAGVGLAVGGVDGEVGRADHDRRDAAHEVGRGREVPEVLDRLGRGGADEGRRREEEVLVIAVETIA